MNVVPVADQGENQKHQGDQQQAGSLRRVHRVAVMLVTVVWSGSRHADIVDPTQPIWLVLISRLVNPRPQTHDPRPSCYTTASCRKTTAGSRASEYSSST